MNADAPEQSIIAEYIKRWGNASSIALLDPKCRFFSQPEIEGIVGYRVESRCALVFGDPLCAQGVLKKLIEAFHSYCQKQELSVIYTTISKNFALRLKILHGGVLIQVGENLFLDPHHDPETGSKGRKLRNKIKQPLNAGVIVKEYLEEDKIMEHDIEEAALQWLKARQGPQIYLANVHLFSYRCGKRWFYAQHEEKIVGILLLNKLDAREGWLVNLVLATPDAPVGTSELLISSVLKTLREEGCHFITFGVAQSEELGEIKGFGRVSKFIARSVFNLAKKIFRLDARRKYWKKFRPLSEPTFVLFCRPRIGLREVIGVLRAYNVF